MSWISVAINTTAESAEPLSDALLEAGALSVTVTDAADGAFAEQPIFGEPGEFVGYWNDCIVTALFTPEFDVTSALSEASEASALAPIPTYQTSQIDEQDWVKLTQSQFSPIQISARLWVVPSWHNAPDPQAINLVLDPGRAFGTGSHPTTLLCLRWLDSHIRGGETVLDYGCGSGILAIAAVKLGAGLAVGTDIDPISIEVAEQNALENRTPIEFLLPIYVPSTQFDVTVANILANPLKMLADIVVGRTRPGGWIVLSGILKSQATDVIGHYGPAVALEIVGEESGWICLAGLKKS
ncbi:MAG: 50S ribosomal protein L11 methyltransferase [Burkholderiales bacterium]